MIKITNLISYLVGAVLLFSGISKVFFFRHFLSNVDSYNILPGGWILHLSGILIASEILLGILLFIRMYQGLSAGISTVLFSFFLTVSIYSVLQKIDIDCGCFGSMSSKVADIKHFVLLTLLLSGSTFVFIRKELID